LARRRKRKKKKKKICARSVNVSILEYITIKPVNPDLKAVCMLTT